jgi:predicted DNA-binding protein (MmcQ/YjbR family)
VTADGGVPAATLGRIRSICLSLPEAEEQTTWGHPTFRVRTKIFVGCGATEDSPARITMSMKAAAGEQQSLLATGHPFFLPKYVGSKGWIGIEIDVATDWEEIAELVEDSYREIAPRRLAAELD